MKQSDWIESSIGEQRARIQKQRRIPRVAEDAETYVKQILDYGFHNTTSVGISAELESRFAETFDVSYAILHSNGTTTMHSALLAAGVGAGDEVIVPPLTAGATGLVVLHANALPIFADVDPDTLTIDPADIRRKISPRTKAIIPVAIYGLPPDLDEIMDIAAEHDLIVIEDNAQCYLSTYRGRTVGSIGHFASYSFQASKHMTCGDGGILICDDESLADAARKVNSFGYATASARPGASKMSEDLRCSPDAKRHVRFGFNFRLPDIAAAVLRAEIDRLPELVAMRIECASLFAEAADKCSWLIPQTTPEDRTHSYWTYVCRITDDEIDWAEFRKRFVELGGDGFYGAWRPTYREPVFSELSKAIQANPERYPQFAELAPDYREVECPVLERVQPKLVQLKTNYFDLDEAAEQARILGETISSINKSKRT